MWEVMVIHQVVATAIAAATAAAIAAARRSPVAAAAASTVERVVRERLRWATGAEAGPEAVTSRRRVDEELHPPPCLTSRCSTK